MAVKRALGTFAVGQYTELLDIARPTYRHYAERHGYDYVEADTAPVANGRPPSWWRIPLLQQLLSQYDEVLWLGCDVVIVNSSDDIADRVPGDAWQSMVVHRAPQGHIPNCDVWYLTGQMLPWLDEAWGLTEYMNHAWWEQAAVTHLMGYDPSRFPLRKVRPSNLYDNTHFLPLEWNSHESLDPHPSPRFAHATHGGFGWRKQVMERYRAEADCG